MRNGQQHHNQNHKRMRGRNRRSGGGHNPLTRVYESTGPDVKIRGTAHHVAEKYLQLARDAQSSGDPVSAESYLQHAEHYFRLIAAAQQQMAQQNPNYQQPPTQRGDTEGGDDEDGDEGDGGDQRFQSPYQEQPQQSQQSQPPQQNSPRPQPQNMPQPSVPDSGLPAFITGGAPQQGGEGEQSERSGNRFNRNRGRSRFNNRQRGDGENREQGAQPAEAAAAKSDPVE